MKPEAWLRMKSTIAAEPAMYPPTTPKALARVPWTMSIRSIAPIALRDPGATLAVEPDGVDLVEIGHRPVFFGDVADLGDRGEVSVHRVERFEGDDLGRVGVALAEQPVEMFDVVVAEDLLLGSAVADACDHRGMVVRIGNDDAAGQGLAERARASPRSPRIRT